MGRVARPRHLHCAPDEAALSIAFCGLSHAFRVLFARQNGGQDEQKGEVLPPVEFAAPHSGPVSVWGTAVRQPSTLDEQRGYNLDVDLE